MSPVTFLGVPIPAPEFAGTGKRYRFQSKTARESRGIEIADCYKYKHWSLKYHLHQFFGGSPLNITEQQIVKLGPPVGKADAYLPLELMEPQTFALFCCELIKKRLKIENGEIVDAMTIGISGQSQFGADIFTHRQHGNQDVYSLYEVKRCKNSQKVIIFPLSSVLMNIGKNGR
ncbi:hypothetical protein [Klebsiella michiganensis]|uniref:hypothetical protein n=1 Tax=Klebsiella michiganensis TaxID=1134687 RepID=UPI00292E720C|nr:hypothetical protein [Klebsiella michiganensis]